MDREKAMRMYQEKTAKRLQEYRAQMGEHLLERSDQLEQMVAQAMGRLGETMERQKKEYVSFLYISLLKTDLVNRNHRFLLHAMDLRWYLDEEPAEVYFDAGDLFDPLDALWEDLTEASREYMGAINQYDIQHMIFAELKSIDRTIAQILRYRLRDWEKKGTFSKVTLYPRWFFKWGEYRDQTEMILQTDRTEKEKRSWKEEVRKTVHKPDAMVFSYWYQGSYEESRIEKLDLRFIVFEEGELRNLMFLQCSMEGARFTNSSLYGCSFENCNLWGADFTGCTFEEVSFQGAELTGALFPAESVPFLDLDPEQLQTILLKREED